MNKKLKGNLSTNNDFEQQGHFSFLSIQPTFFEEAVKRNIG
jgi:hypothetical protein